jgi:hypothetical protein
VGKAVLKKKTLETVHESVQPSTTTPETNPETTYITPETVVETDHRTPETNPETTSGTPETTLETVGDDRKREVIRLYNEGRTYNQISVITKIAKGTVSRILREAGLIDLDPSEIRMRVQRSKGGSDSQHLEHYATGRDAGAQVRRAQGSHRQ